VNTRIFIIVFLSALGLATIGSIIGIILSLGRDDILQDFK
jgi:hypothetical protein